MTHIVPPPGPSRPPTPNQISSLPNQSMNITSRAVAMALSFMVLAGPLSPVTKAGQDANGPDTYTLTVIDGKGKRHVFNNVRVLDVCFSCDQYTQHISSGFIGLLKTKDGYVLETDPKRDVSGMKFEVLHVGVNGTRLISQFREVESARLNKTWPKAYKTEEPDTVELRHTKTLTVTLDKNNRIFIQNGRARSCGALENILDVAKRIEISDTIVKITDRKGEHLSLKRQFVRFQGHADPNDARLMSTNECGDEIHFNMASISALGIGSPPGLLPYEDIEQYTCGEDHAIVTDMSGASHKAYLWNLALAGAINTRGKQRIALNVGSSLGFDRYVWIKDVKSVERAGWRDIRILLRDETEIDSNGTIELGCPANGIEDMKYITWTVPRMGIQYKLAVSDIRRIVFPDNNDWEKGLRAAVPDPKNLSPATVTTRHGGKIEAKAVYINTFGHANNKYVQFPQLDGKLTYVPHDYAADVSRYRYGHVTKKVVDVDGISRVGFWQDRKGNPRGFCGLDITLTNGRQFKCYMLVYGESHGGSYSYSEHGRFSAHKVVCYLKNRMALVGLADMKEIILREPDTGKATKSPVAGK